MKSIVCELCGGTDFVKQEGVFICQGCGTKYSIEEAKKLMQEVTGQSSAVFTDNQIIKNYLELAKNALDSENNKEAESYANKIIEQAPHHSVAWKIKGCAAYRKEPDNILGFKEAMSAWNRAANYCDNESKENLINDINKEIKDAADVLMYSKYKAFIEKPNKSFKEGLISTLYTIIKSINDWIIDQNAMIDMNEMTQGFSRALTNTAMQGFNTLKNACKGHYEVLDRQANMVFRSCGMQTIDLLKLAFRFSRSTDDSQTILHEQQKISDVLLNQLPMQLPNDLGGRILIGGMKKDYDELPTKRRGINLEKQKKRILEACFDERIQEEKQAAINQYWAQHQEEKEKLQQVIEKATAEEDRLKEQLDVLNEQITKCQAQAEQKTENEAACVQIESDIAGMKSELNTLGIFKGKRKKELTSLIEQKEKELSSKKTLAQTERGELSNKVATETNVLKHNLSEIEAEVDIAAKRREEAEAELNKDRGTISSGNPFYINECISNGKFCITAKEYAEKMWVLLDATYRIPNDEKRFVFREVEEEGILRQLPRLGNFNSLGYKYVYLVDENRVDEAIDNHEEVFLDVDIVEHAENENSPINAIVLEYEGMHPSEISDDRLKGWCELGAAILCSFIKNMSLTEAVGVLADMIMDQGPQVFEKDGITANLLYVSSKDYTSNYERRLLIRCK